MPTRFAIAERDKVAVRQGRAIAAFRASAGLTQVELAARLGVRTHTVSNWECGSRVASLARRRAMVALGGDPIALETTAGACPHCGRPYG